MLFTESVHEDLQYINKLFRCIAIKMIVFTVVLSAVIIGETLNIVKQIRDFNTELDQKYAQIEQQFNRIDERYEQNEN